MINSVKIDENEKKVIINGEVYYLTKEKPTAVETSSFDRAKMNCNYYYIDMYGEIRAAKDLNGVCDQSLYEISNYCQDKELLKKRAKEEVLMRKLWRFSMEHGGYSVYLINGKDSIEKYFIMYVYDEYDNVKTFVSSAYTIVPGTIYFSTREYAEAAAAKFYEDFQEVYDKRYNKS